jgi:hypothetical protein
MSLPERYGKRLRQALGAFPVWLPGTPVALGCVMVRGEGQFRPVDDLSSFTNVMKSAPHQDRSLDLVSKGTRQRLFQANAELPGAAKLDLTAEATLKVEFERAFEYVVKAPTLKGQHITNVNQVAQAVKALPNWEHDRFYIVHEVYEADEFSFLGTETSKASMEFSGKGAAILGFLTAGASAGLTSTGNVDVKILGKGGALAMGLVRVKKNGKTDYAP